MIIVTRELNEMNNPKVFFEISADDENLGRIVFELKADIVPKTVENFQKLCDGYNNKRYKDTLIHRIVPGYFCQVFTLM